MLVHSVYFYFKDDVTEDQIAKCRKMAEDLKGIETVKDLFVGSPAAVPERPVLVRGYKFGITVLFDSIEDHNIYQAHQLHTDYLTNAPLWEKVRVFDTM